VKDASQRLVISRLADFSVFSATIVVTALSFGRAGLYSTRSVQLTHILKAPGFNPCT
jgi:hypothetical protein